MWPDWVYFVLLFVSLGLGIASFILDIMTPFKEHTFFYSPPFMCDCPCGEHIPPKRAKAFAHRSSGGFFLSFFSSGFCPDFKTRCSITVSTVNHTALCSHLLKTAA